MKLVFEEGKTKYTKSEILEGLYDRAMEMRVHIDDGVYITIADVDLRGLDGRPDCLIGSFSQNWYIRTPTGKRGKEYTSMAGLIGAISKEIEKLGKDVYKLEVRKYGTKEVLCNFVK